MGETPMTSWLCDILTVLEHFVLSYVMWPGWRRAGAGCWRHGPPPPAPPTSPSSMNWGNGSTCTDMVLIGLVALLATCVVNTSHTLNYRDFQKITESDQKITKLEIHSRLFYACSGPRLRFPERDLSYPKNVPTFFNYRRFEGVEAPEGCENVP